jgi:hypothetical protein
MRKPVYLTLAGVSALLCLGLLGTMAADNFRAPFMFIFVLIFAAATFYIGRVALTKPRTLYCRNCGVTASPTMHMPGSFALELLLWLCFLLPGLVYSIWRITSVREVCPDCGAPNMIPLNSPAATRARR